MFEPYNWFKIAGLLRKFDFAIDCEPYLNLSAIVSFLIASRRIGFSHGIRSLLYTDKIGFNDQQHEVLTYMDVVRKFGIRSVPKKLVKLGYSKKDRKNIDNLLLENKIRKNDFSSFENEFFKSLSVKLDFCFRSTENSSLFIYN